MKYSPLILGAACLLFFVVPSKVRASETSPASSIVEVTKDGVVPVTTSGGQLPKNSGKTYFLSSATKKPAANKMAQSTKIIKPAPTPSPSSVTIVKKAKQPSQKNGCCKKTDAKLHHGKSVPLPDDDANDEYARAAAVPDPIEPLNRGTFWVNHQIYRYIFRPVSRTYDTVVPSAVRKGVFNVFDNLEFPKRFVNDLLQGRLPQAGMESEKFVVNSVAGVGGIMKVSDRIPALADLPRPDTGQTLAKWGINHGAYVVVPVFGPKSARDTVGLAGDIALSPVFWVSIFFPAVAWIPAVTTPDSVRGLHDRLSAYDAVTENTMDRYLAARSAYIQNRAKAASQ